jgi:hypothetical protein
MIIYNVTIKVNEAIAKDWLLWLQQEHIPDLINTGCFTKAVVLKLLDESEPEDPTYAVQYYAENKARLDSYLSQFATEMRNRAFAKWGDQFIAFRSVMEVVN